MKNRILSVLLILAMVASLCAVAVVTPAAAQVTAVTVTLSNANAGQTSGYTINFTTGAALTAGQVVNIHFPAGCDLSGASLQGTTTNSPYQIDGANIANPSITGQVLSLPAPAAGIAAGAHTLTIAQSAGIINPDVSQEPIDPTIPANVQDSAVDSPYVYQVNTEVDVIKGGSQAVVNDYVSCDDYSLVPDQDVTVTGGGLTPNYTVQISGPVSGVGTIGADGTFTVTGVATGTGGANALPLMAKDGTGRVAYILGAMFTVMPTLTVSPASGLPGALVTVNGYNFTPGAGIWSPGTILIAGNTVLITQPVVAAGSRDLDQDNSRDDFSVQGNIPAGLAGGIYEITCVDRAAAGSPVAKTTYEVTTRQITVDPPAGAPGATVVISGIGFPKNAANGTAILMFGNSGASGTITSMGAILVDDTGAFTVTGIVPPNATAGAHGVIVYFNTTQAAAIPYNALAGDLVQAQGMFTVTSRALTIIPDSGPLGTKITLSGGGMYLAGVPAPTATLTVAGAVWTGMGTNGVVALNSAGDIIPDTSPALNALFGVGNNTILATHNTNPALTSSAIFEVIRPTFTLDLSQGPRGTQVIGTGGGWLAGEINFVTVMMQVGNNDPQTVGIATPDGDGNIWFSFKIPSDIVIIGANVNVTFTANDNNGNTSLIVPFTVTRPSIEVEPTSGAPGSEISVMGEGFLPQCPVTNVQIFGANLVRVDDLPITDTTGGFDVTGVIPGLAPGGYAITSTVQGVTVTASFTVLTGGAGDITVALGFATIDGLYTRVWTYDATTQEWQVYETAAGAPSDFTTLVKGQGYWLEVTQDCVLTYGAHTYNLYLGWNLIGWLG